MRRKAVRHFPCSLASAGTTERLTIPYNAGTFDLSTTDFSWAGWVDIRTQDSHGLISTGVAGSDANSFLFRYRNSTSLNLLQVIINNGSGGVLSGSVEPPVRLDRLGWAFLTVTADRDGNAEIFLDRVSLGTIDISSKDGSIGTDDWDMLNQIVDSALDGNQAPTWIWNRVITQAEIDDLYFDNIVASSGLLVEYLFPEGVGTSVADTSGQGNTGTLTGGTLATWSPDTPFKKRLAVRNFENALVVNGTSGTTSFGDNFEFDKDDSFSVSLWVKFNSISNESILAKRNGSAEGWELKVRTTGLQFIAEGANGGASQLNSDNPMELNKWMQIIFTYDGVNDFSGAKMYIDGHVVPTTIAFSALNDTMVNNLDLILGDRPTGGLVLNGAATQLRLHNAALTADEVIDLYYDDVANDVVGEWLMTDDSGTILTATVGGINGTITTPDWSTDTPFKARTAITQARTAITQARTSI